MSPKSTSTWRAAKSPNSTPGDGSASTPSLRWSCRSNGRFTRKLKSAFALSCSCLPSVLHRSLTNRLGTDVGPQLIEFLRAEHAAPGRHLALAVGDGLVEPGPLIGAKPPQVKSRAGVDQAV